MQLVACILHHSFVVRHQPLREGKQDKKWKMVLNNMGWLVHELPWKPLYSRQAFSGFLSPLHLFILLQHLCNFFGYLSIVWYEPPSKVDYVQEKLESFLFLGNGMLLMASILFGSIFITSFSRMFHSSFPSLSANWYFLGFKGNPYFLHFSKVILKCLMCSSYIFFLNCDVN